ncbi:phage tail tape measure protein, partial [Gracilibacillus lacisalsi]|uniref:phage tail tape measure protein n=1 Tax=Gracilibacillus lacisalsi TaxID=393087 RepID=UPI00037599C9
MANVGALRTTISLDSAQFTQSMAGVNRQLKSLQQEQKAVTSSGTGFARGVEELRKKSDVLNRTLELQQAKVNELKRRYEDSKKATGDNSRETQRAQTAYNKAVAEMNKTENALKSITEELNRQTNPWKQLETNLNNASDKLKVAGEKMTNFGRNMTMKVTTPILGLGGAMLKTGIDFESSMSNVQAISGATGDDLQQLEDRARELGATTSKSASEAADGLGYMALAGWETEEMLQGIEPVLRLSEAGNIDLARASDLATDSMSALQIEAKDLPAYLDNVAEASRNSNTSVDALMDAYITAGGNLSEFNVPLEESTAILGLLANRGLKGSEAGRALNAIMVNLTSGAGQAGEALEELEISAFDADGEFIGLEETLRLVKDRTKDMTDEQKAQYISMIAGKEHLKSFQGLLAGLDDEYGDLKENVSDADGALNNMAETMQDNAQGNINRLKSSFEELSIQFSEHVLPAFTRGVEKLTEVVDWFGELDDSTQDNIIKMAGFAAA